jgi:peptide/nickel transport system permease protein
LIPLTTIIVVDIAGSVGGALITETLYGYPGMGMLSVSAAQNDDIIVVMGVTMIASALTVIGSIVADVLYAFADPRIRLGAAN